MELCFFDHNATTPLAPEAKEAWITAVDQFWFNPSSPYRAGARVQVHFEAARQRLADLFGVEPERIAFNSGATEGNNAIFEYWAATLPADALVGVSPTEHPSVIEAAKQRFGDRIVWLALDAHGAVNPAKIPWERIAAISVMAANNETGLLNPWQEIAESAAARGVMYHCDASQWIGKLPLAGLGACDYLTGCAHKFGGPRGVGFWLLPKGSGLRAIRGGAQEAMHRAGTEDVAGVLAMVAALEHSKVGTASGRDRFEDELPECMIVGQKGSRLWNTSLIVMPQFSSARWIRGLEKRGFLVSSGAACAAGKQAASNGLEAMGLPADALQRTLRVSSGSATSAADWKRLAEAFRTVKEALTVEAEQTTSNVISLD